MDLDQKISLKKEIKKEFIEEDSQFDPEFWYDFDDIKKEEIEVSEEFGNGDEGHTFSNLLQEYKLKIEDLTDEKKAPRDQFEEIRQSEFPLVFLPKLDIDITDKVRITCVDETNYVIKIFRYNGDEVHFEEALNNMDSLQNLQNYGGSYATRSRKGKCENSSYPVGPITEALASKIPHEKLKKVRRKHMKNSKTVDNVKRTGKTLRCRICDYKTKLNCNLKRHMGIHVSVSTYNCEECDYSTNRRDNLVTHILSHYDCKFKCSVCTYKTGDKRGFNRHMLIHSDEKLFKCRFCDFKTNYKDQLKTHEFNHSGKKQFMCSECNYKTNYKRNLARHELNHSGTKALECHACGYQTNDTGHLKRHRKAFSH